METGKFRKSNNRKMLVPIVIFMNLFCFMIAGGIISSSKLKRNLEKYTENWEQVDVTIDDVEFVYDGEETERDSNNYTRTVYHFHMDRILKYTYKGEYYEVKSTDRYEKDTKDFYMEPRTDYKDGRIYLVNPASPTSVAMYYSSGSDSLIKGFEVAEKGMAALAICVAVVIDIVFVMGNIRKKRVKFDEEE